MPRILYIGQTPAEGTGSPVIILRHLQRLAADGWRVTIIAESGQDASACQRAGWIVHTLPLRRAGWPPFRESSELSRAVRTWLLAGECLRLTSAAQPDAVLGYLAAHADFSAEIATRYARRAGVPLTLLVHDEAAAFTAEPAAQKRLRRRHARLLRRAHRTWFVSRELSAAFTPKSSESPVLPPLPGGGTAFVEWQSKFSDRPRVYYAGFIWPAQYALLHQIAGILAEAGAILVLITRKTPELGEFLRTAPAQHVAPFATNREVLDHLARDAAGILVSYAHAIAQMPWIATSFPSKLVEQCQLGLPCAIVAPPASAVANWAQHTGYAETFSPSALGRLGEWARDLRHEKSWRIRAAPVRLLAAAEFNPDKIHATFAAGLLRA
jgi:Glycosyltransferase Family 4